MFDSPWSPKPSSLRQCRLNHSSRTTHSASKWSSVSRSALHTKHWCDERTAEVLSWTLVKLSASYTRYSSKIFFIVSACLPSTTLCLSQVGCATTCCLWRIVRTWERAAGRDGRSTTTASLCLEAHSRSPAATSTPRYQTTYSKRKNGKSCLSFLDNMMIVF